MEDLQEEIAELQKDLDDLFLLTEKKQPTLEKVDKRYSCGAKKNNFQQERFFLNQKV